MRMMMRSERNPPRGHNALLLQNTVKPRTPFRTFTPIQRSKSQVPILPDACSPL